MKLRWRSRWGVFQRGMPVLAVLAGIAFSSICQERKISIQPHNYIDTTGFGKRIDSLRDVASLRRLESIAMVLPIIDSAFALLKFAPNTYRYMRCLGTKGIIFHTHGRTNEAGHLLHEGYELAIKHNFKRSINRFPHVIGNNEWLKGNYDLALKYQLKYYAGMLAEGDSIGLGMACNNLAIIYYKLTDFEKAISYYKKSLKYDNNAIININLGLSFNSLGKFDSAQFYIHKGWASCTPRCDNDINFHYHLALGVVYSDMKQFENAELFLKKCLVLSRKDKNKSEEVQALAALGSNYIYLVKYEEAEFFLQKAEKLAKYHGFRKNNLDACQFLIELYKRKADYHKLTSYRSKLISLWEEVYSDEFTNKVSSMESEFSEQNNNVMLLDQQKQLNLQNQVLASRRYLNELLILTSVLLLFTVFFLFRLNRISTKMNREIEMLVQLRTGSILSSFKQAICNGNELDLKISALQSEIKYTTATVRGVCNLINKMDVLWPRSELLRWVTELEEHSSEVRRIFKVF